MVGAASSTVSTPAASAASAQPSSSSSGRSGTIAPSMPASASAAAKRSVAHVADRVVVGHHRPAGRRRRASPTVVDDARRRRAEVERALRRLLDRAAVHHRVGERDADLDRVGAGVGDRAHDVEPVRAEPAGDVRDEQLVPGLAPGRAGAPRATHVTSRSPVRRSATWAASLSPRPDSVTSTVEPRRHRAAGLAGEPADRVRGLERGHDALGHRQELEPGERLVVGGERVLGPARRRELRRARGRRPGSRGPALIECASRIWPSSSCRNSERAPCSTPGTPRLTDAPCWPDSSPWPPASTPTSRGVGVEEPGERAHRVRAAADARDHEVGVVAAEDRAALLARFVADDALELAHHPRDTDAARRPSRCSSACVSTRRDPVAQRLVDRVLERRAAADVTGHDLGAEQLHAEHVERLALDVDRAHEHDAVEPEQRRRGGGGDAVLAGAGLGDDALLAHAPGEQRLAEHVVDLVRAGVGEVLALEQHPHAEALARAGGTR